MQEFHRASRCVSGNQLHQVSRTKRILKGYLGLSKTVISGRLVHDWRGLGCDDCGAMEKPKEHHFLLCGFLL